MNHLIAFVILTACGDASRNDHPMAEHGHEPASPHGLHVTIEAVDEPALDSAEGFIEAPEPVRVAVANEVVEHKACEGKMDVGPSGELICKQIDSPTPAP